MGLTRSGIRVLVRKGRIHSNDSIYPSCPMREVRTGFYKKTYQAGEYFGSSPGLGRGFSNFSPQKNPGNMSLAP